MVAIEEELRPLPDILDEQMAYADPVKTELHLGELGFGTRVYDPRAAEGLNTLLQMNGYDEIDHTYLAGGLMAEFPEVYSVNNAERQRFLDQFEDVEEAEIPERVEHLVRKMMEEAEEEGDMEHFEHYKEKWVNGKIDSRDMLEEYARTQIEKLFDGIDVDRIDYCQGEEDRFNRKELEKQWVKKFARKAKKYKEKLEKRVEEKEEELEEYEEKFDGRSEEYDVVKDLKQRVSAHHTHAEDPDVAAFIEQLLVEQENDIFAPVESDERRERLRERIRGIDTYESFQRLYRDVEGEVERWEEKLGEAMERKDYLEEELDSVQNQLEQGDAITIFTKRAAIKPSEADWLYKFVKDRYTRSIFNCFPDEIEEDVHPHVSWAATINDVEFEYETEEGEGRGLLEEADMEMYGDTLVLHSTKFRSKTTSPHGMHEAKREALYRRLITKVRNETEGTVPRQILVPHGSGGFWASRVNVAPEFKLAEGDAPSAEEMRDDPQLVSVEMMPTFQSIDRLIEMKDKGVSTWNVKRVDRGEHQSGAVLKTRFADGEELYEVLDLSGLIEIGEKKRELEQYEEGSDPYEEAKRELEEMCSMNFKVRASTSDWHIGDANFEGTPANFDRVQSTINYLNENFADFADEIIVGELSEGTLDHTDMEKMYYADALPEIRDGFAHVLQELMENADMSKEELAELFSDSVEEFTQALTQVPIAQYDKQEEVVERYLEELVNGVRPPQVTAISGNHNRPNDEARAIKRMIEKMDEEIDVVMATSNGSKQGGQGGVKNEIVDFDGERKKTGKDVGYYHRVPGGKHSSKRIWRHLLESGYMFDEFFGQHINEGMAGMVDGMEITISPAGESPGPYSESLPVPGCVYGTIVKFSNAAPEDHPANGVKRAAWLFANDDTLEKDTYQGDELDASMDDLFETVKGDAAA